MVICGGKHYNSFEELGDAMLASLPKKRQPVKWWRGIHIYRCRHSDYLNMSPLGRIKAWLPHFSKSRSWVGYFWLHVFLFNRWDFMFKCGYYGPLEHKKEKANG